MAKNDWVNKPVPFKRTDPLDNARYEFARKIPFTAIVKGVIDYMMGNKLSPTFINASPEIPLREFTQQSDVIEEIFDEIDESQFL